MGGEAMSDLDQIAATLRKKYWVSVGESRGPWESASPKSKQAWIDVAMLARVMWKGVPR